MTSAPQPSPVAAPPAPPVPIRRRRRSPWWWGAPLLALVVAAAVWAAWQGYAALVGSASTAVPTAQVERGDVRLDVHALGTLKGGHSEILVAPPIAGGTLSLKALLPNGSPVKSGEVVAAFDTAAQEYNLTQAHEALEQAQQQVVQAQATADGQTEDDNYQLAKAKFDVQRAQLQVRGNPLKAAVDAKKNDLTLATAQAHLAQLQKDVANNAANNAATVAVQQAAVRKAQADATTAEHNIASMTLRAHHDGYVSVRPNSSTNILYAGMTLPPFQLGDTVDPGQAVVEIPDMSSWEVDLQVEEQDAGHLSAGEPVVVRFVALPGQDFSGTLQSVGQASGPPWQRRVAVVVQLLHPSAALRPGMSATAVITTAQLRNVLWVPSEAVFDNGGGSYVYRQAHGQFQRQPVTVVERSESQVVLRGVAAGEVIALANPEDRSPAPGAAGGRGAGPAALAGRGR